MKTKLTYRILIFVNLCVLNFHLKAQSKEFAPVGATWYYDWPGWPMPTITYTTLECLKDTVLLGINTKQITNGHFVYENNKQVFLFQPQINDFTLLYDFNKNTGETWDVVTPLWGIADTFTVIVDSVGVEIINSDTLKVQYIRSLDMLWSFDGKTIEFLGNEAYFFPQYGLADPHAGPLRCYMDIDYSYNPLGIPCDTSYVVSLDSIHRSKNFIVFPNPAQDFISIDFADIINNPHVQILDLLGKVLLEIEIVEQRIKIYVGDLPNGVHLLKVNHGNTFYVKKFIKY